MFKSIFPFGCAAALAIADRCRVQDVSYDKLRTRPMADGQTVEGPAAAVAR